MSEASASAASSPTPTPTPSETPRTPSPTPPTPTSTPPGEKRLLMPEVLPTPELLYRVQRSAARDARGAEHFPGSVTQDHEMLGVNAGFIFPLSFECRVNKENVERALDPANTADTGLIALYSDKDKAMADFEFYHAVGCVDVYIIHISTDDFIRGTLNMRARPHGEEHDRLIALPVLGVEDPSLFIFPAVAVTELFQIRSTMCPKDVWFAADSIPAKHVVRREARRFEADWSDRDERWNRWGASSDHLNFRGNVEGLGGVDESPKPLPRSPSMEPPMSPSLVSLPLGAMPGASGAGKGLGPSSLATEGGRDGAGLLRGVAGVGIPEEDESPETTETMMSTPSPTLEVLTPTMGDWLRDPVEGPP